LSIKKKKVDRPWQRKLYLDRREKRIEKKRRDQGEREGRDVQNWYLLKDDLFICYQSRRH